MRSRAPLGETYPINNPGRETPTSTNSGSSPVQHSSTVVTPANGGPVTRRAMQSQQPTFAPQPRMGIRNIPIIRLTNALIFLSVLLIMIYVMREFNQVPKDCESQVQTFCASEYVRTGGLSADVASRSCGDLRDDCWTSISYKLFVYQSTTANISTLNQDQDQLQQAFLLENNEEIQRMARFCGCLMGYDADVDEDDVYCVYYWSRVHFFWTALVLCLLVDHSTMNRKAYYFRPCLLLLSVIWLLAIGVVFSKDDNLLNRAEDRCNSPEFDDKADLLEASSFSAAILLFLVAVADLVLWLKIMKDPSGKSTATRVVPMRHNPAVAAPSSSTVSQEEHERRSHHLWDD